MSEWDELNQIDVAKMFEETSPRYFIPHCRLNRFNTIKIRWHFDSFIDYYSLPSIPFNLELMPEGIVKLSSKIDPVKQEFVKTRTDLQMWSTL